MNKSYTGTCLKTLLQLITGEQKKKKEKISINKNDQKFRDKKTFCYIRYKILPCWPEFSPQISGTDEAPPVTSR